MQLIRVTLNAGAILKSNLFFLSSLINSHNLFSISFSPILLQSCLLKGTLTFSKTYCSGLSNNLYYIIWTKHHILLDGWSSHIILNSVFNIYKNIILGEKITLKHSGKYIDYIKWLSEQNKNKVITYWNKYLNGQ